MSLAPKSLQLSSQAVWPVDRIKDHASKIGSGVTPSGGATSYLDEGIPLLRSQNVHFDGLRLGDVAYISEQTHAEMSGTQLTDRDVLLNITGASIGRCTFVPDGFGEGNVNQHVCIIRTTARLHYKFLTYCLAGPWGQDQVLSSFTGASRQGLGQRDLGEIQVPLPPLPEQQRIAAYLDSTCAAIDAAVAAKRRQIETLDALRKSVAHQVLSEGLRPGLPLKDSGIESIGVIPAHWDVKQLRYACEVNYGITLQLEKGQGPGDGVRILTVSNITIDGNLDLEDEYYIDAAQLTSADYLQQGDLLFNWRNGSQYHVGKTAFFDLEGEFAHVSFLLRIRCGRHMDPFFLRSYLGVLKDAGFFSGAKDKVNKTFNSTELKRLQVVIPPRDEQKEVCLEIQQRARKVDDVEISIQAQIEILTAYRKSLIHECVTGQRRVTEADLQRAGGAQSVCAVRQSS
jgi:type I restriction enzyme S subunit